MSDISNDEPTASEVPVIEDALSPEDLDGVSGGNAHAEIVHAVHTEIVRA